MRVHYIGNFSVGYTTESHVALSLEALGHEVVRHQENEVDWRRAGLIARRLEGDFVLWTHTHGFADESTHDYQDELLDGLRARSIPTVSYHLDRWWGLEREEQLAEPYFTTDLVCTADGGHQEQWDSIGVNHVWFPPAVVHTEVGRGRPQSRYAKDVGFVGSWMHYGHRALWPWRFELVAQLSKRYRSRFRAWPRGNVPVRGEQLNDLYASVRVVVGDSCLAGSAHHYWSDRVPETIGRGGFLLHPYVAGLDDEFPPELLPLRFDAGDFDSVVEQVELALSFSDDDRAGLIEASMRHVEAHHTYLARMVRLTGLIGEMF